MMENDRAVRRLVSAAIPGGLPTDSAERERVMQLFGPRMTEQVVGMNPETVSLAMVASARQRIADGTFEEDLDQKLNVVVDGVLQEFKGV